MGTTDSTGTVEATATREIDVATADTIVEDSNLTTEDRERITGTTEETTGEKTAEIMQDSNEETTTEMSGPESVGSTGDTPGRTADSTPTTREEEATHSACKQQRCS